MRDSLMIVVITTGWSAAACNTKVLRFDAVGGEPAFDCPAAPDWLPETAAPSLAQPAGHPQTECPFYQASFQHFLRVTQPAANGDPVLVTYSTIDDAFIHSPPLADGVLAAAGTHRGTPARAWLRDIRQPGNPGIAIDRFGHAIYYGLHLNQAFLDFIASQGLTTPAGILAADPGLTLPPEVLAIKSAWMDIDPADGVSGDFSGFITTDAWVSWIRDDPTTGIVADADHPRQIRVALVALDLAFGLPGHPELIRASFGHVNPSGAPDVTPNNTVNADPSSGDPLNQMATWPISMDDLLLYRGGTPAYQANRAFDDSALSLDENAQLFAQTTSIYRMFVASRSHTTSERSEIKMLNQHVSALFAERAAELSAADQRGSYRLLGALWMDKPTYFAVDSALQNDQTSPFLQPGQHLDQQGNVVGPVTVKTLSQSIAAEGTDSPYSILAGQDRLSNPAIESFTQGPGLFANCLGCHNTGAVAPSGVPAANSKFEPVLLPPKLINVSRVFSQYLVEECGASGTCAP